MTDQPPPSPDHVDDRPATNQSEDHCESATDQPTTPAWLSLGEAAALLGISENAVRQRIKRGTVLGVKSDLGWFIDVSRRSTSDQPPPSATIGYHRPTNQTIRATDHQPTIDLVPLTELIDALTRRNADLAAAAAMWQTRAAHLENQLKQLAPGTIDPETTPKTAPMAQNRTETTEIPPSGIWTWVKRLWKG